MKINWKSENETNKNEVCVQLKNIEMQICIHYLQLGSGRFELSLVT